MNIAGWFALFLQGNVSDGTARIVSVVKEHIGNGKMVQDVGSDVVFCLPEFNEEGARQRDKFPALFDELDAKMDVLGLDSYGVSDTTLEEVTVSATSCIQMKLNPPFSERFS